MFNVADNFNCESLYWAHAIYYEYNVLTDPLS